jgi:uncharacterized surface protein with fasciclin (FAS1) repeats
MLNRRILFIAAAAAVMAGCATQPAPVSIADTIASNPSLSTLNGLVAKAGLTETLKSGGPFTVFAPTNDAFKAVPAKTLDELAQDPAKLKAVLTYHVIPARITSADVKTSSVKTVNGSEVALAKAGEFVTVEDAMVQTADINATNGVVQVVDRVLMPPRR